MGSTSDWDTMRHSAELLTEFDVPHECRVVSAHRTPAWLTEYAESAEARGLEVIIAGAGGAAHLPGMVAANTVVPVLGVPVQSHALNGLDSLLSIAQMPGGVPVGTLAIGKAGARNAALLAVAILANHRPDLRAKLHAYRTAQIGGSLGPDPPYRIGHTTMMNDPILPGATIGILGSGQLGRMLALVARRMGYRVHVFSTDADSPTGQVADLEDGGALTITYRLPALSPGDVDVVTYEFENVPALTAATIAEVVPVRPGSDVLHISAKSSARKRVLRGQRSTGDTVCTCGGRRRSERGDGGGRFGGNPEDGCRRLRRQGPDAGRQCRGTGRGVGGTWSG